MKAAFVNCENTSLELLETFGENSPIKKFLEKNVLGGVHHLCLQVDDLSAAIDDLKKKGIRFLGDEPKMGSQNKPIIFIHPAETGILIELVGL